MQARPGRRRGGRHAGPGVRPGFALVYGYQNWRCRPPDGPDAPNAAATARILSHVPDKAEALAGERGVRD